MEEQRVTVLRHPAASRKEVLSSRGMAERFHRCISGTNGRQLTEKWPQELSHPFSFGEAPGSFENSNRR